MKSKIFKLSPLWLQTRADADLFFGTELKAVKLTPEQAYNFEKLTSFEEMITKYGDINRLKEGEQYQGYIAIDYDYRQEVAYLDGQLSKISHYPGVNWDYIRACKEGRLWTVDGIFKHVRTVRRCYFNNIIDELECKSKLCSELSSKGLQDKIIEALCKDQLIMLTSDEELVLRHFFEVSFERWFLEL